MLSYVVALMVLTSGPWHTDLPSARKAAAGKPVVVVVHAHWCTPCNQLENEVLQTPDGQALLKRAVGAFIDFDTDPGQAVNAKYGIINLPTTLVLGSDGAERGRVEGFPGRQAYLQALNDVMTGKAGIEVMAKQLKEAPGDLGLMVSYAQARLVRGEIREAKALLDKAMMGKGAVGARAARIWGRYLLRVKKDGPAGTAHFLGAMKTWAGKPAAQGFRYWAARGLHMQGRNDAALALFDQWMASDPRSYDAASYKAGFMVNNSYDPAPTVTAIRTAMALGPEKAWPHYLLAEISLRRGDRTTAVSSIRRAMGMAPKKAIFQNFARRRLGLKAPTE